MAQREELTLNGEKATLFVVRRQKATGEWGGRGRRVCCCSGRGAGRSWCLMAPGKETHFSLLYLLHIECLTHRRRLVNICPVNEYLIHNFCLLSEIRSKLSKEEMGEWGGGYEQFGKKQEKPCY